MQVSEHRCLGIDSLAAYVDGSLSVGEVHQVDVHVDHCGACRGDLSALAAAATRPPLSPALVEQELEGAELEPGLRFGRYVALSELGRGGMGVVVRAYDPELDRAIAVKIVRPELWRHAPDEVRRGLLREAQAMARLSSSNVVTVYDVVTEDDGLALAMELVEGSTLRAWLDADQTRSWTETLATCIAAGRGLEAAHAAQIVHRDFKPDNVLCSEDGRVLVTDFGLARLTEESAEPEATEDQGRQRLVAGTPAYLAPELHSGQTATALSDQFSYCVTVYEALYRERPFKGADWQALGQAMRQGRIEEAAASGTVPGGVRQALLRGLLADPAKRFASISELLAVLEHALGRKARRWRGAGIAGAIALAVVTVLAVRASRPAPVSCAVPEAALSQAWGSEQQGRVTGKLSSLGASPQALSRLDASVQVYRRQWRDARRQVCEATHKRGEQSAALLDRRMACLDRREAELGALGRVLVSSTDAHSAELAIEAVQRLSGPQSCVRAPVQGQALPADADTRALVEAGFAATDLASALVATGGFDAALAGLAEVLGSPAASAHAQLRAEAGFVRGQAYGVHGEFEAAERALFEALEAAQRASDDPLIARIWVELLFNAGGQAHRFEVAHAHEKAASAALARIQVNDELRARFLYVRAGLRLAEHKPREALPLFREALTVTTAARGEDHIEVVWLHKAICDSHRQLHELEEALAQCTLALETGHRVLGRSHPRLAAVFNSLGAVQYLRGKYPVARQWFDKTVTVTEASGGERTPARALALSNIGTAWFSEGKLEEATTALEASREAFERYHPDNFKRYFPLDGLANVAYMRGQYAEAGALYREVMEILERTIGKDTTPAVQTLYNLALSMTRLGHVKEARAIYLEVFERSRKIDGENNATAVHALDALADGAEGTDNLLALEYAERGSAMAEKVYGAEHATLAWSLVRVGNLYRRVGRPAEAVPILERAIAIYEQAKGNAYELGVARYRLARALWVGRIDRQRARRLVRQAQADLRGSEEHRALRMLAAVTSWLREPG